MNKLIESISGSLKAHSAGLGAALTLLLADLDTGSAITLHQWIAIVGAYLGVGAAVHMVPNTAAAAVDPLADALDKTEESLPDDGLDA